MSGPPDATLVDAHVHLYDCFDLAAQLDAARENFERAAAALGRRAGGGVLLLTQPGGDERFERLAAAAFPAGASAGATPGWTFHRTAEPESLAARRGDGTRLDLVCGRQVVTAEGIEVLALGTVSRFEDGRPIRETVAAAEAAGALIVLPWAAGKWFGRRGAIVRGLIEGRDATIACGDNGNRPSFWPRPSLLLLAERLGLRVLPGSDPLPLPSEAVRAGGFGFAIDGALSPDRPAADLKRRLADLRIPLVPYGSLENPLRFIRNQRALRRRSGRRR